MSDLIRSLVPGSPEYQKMLAREKARQQQEGFIQPVPKQQTSFMRVQGTPVHYADGTSLPEADADVLEMYQRAHARFGGGR